MEHLKAPTSDVSLLRGRYWVARSTKWSSSMFQIRWILWNHSGDSSYQSITSQFRLSWWATLLSLLYHSTGLISISEKCCLVRRRFCDFVSFRFHLSELPGRIVQSANETSQFSRTKRAASDQTGHPSRAASICRKQFTVRQYWSVPFADWPIWL